MSHSDTPAPPQRPWWPFTLWTWMAIHFLCILFLGLNAYPRQNPAQPISIETRVDAKGVGWPELMISSTSVRQSDENGNEIIRASPYRLNRRELLVNLIALSGIMALVVLLVQSWSIRRWPAPQLHLSTLMFLSLVMAGLLYLNMITENDVAPKPGAPKSPTETVQYKKYGWPYYSTVQTVTPGASARNFWSYSKTLIFVDFVVAAAILAGTAWVLEWRIELANREKSEATPKLK